MGNYIPKIIFWVEPKESELLGEGELSVKVGEKDDIWVIDRNKAREFIAKYNSREFRRGTELGIIAWNQFDKYRDVSGSNIGTQAILL